MHLHILGICGTFMGGIAVLAREAGHHVSGSDRNVYPPMSTQLEALRIPLHEGFDAAVLTPAPDVVVVGNVMSRGSAVVENLLDSGIPYTSGPQWLAEHVLRGRHVLAVAGTHGKTSTASMLAWILEQAGLKPGFLVGGVPVDFGVSARLGSSKYFVVEADEYDTAFFDKRSKFVHYRPRTLVMTNLEYDHADIFPDIESIRRQFHHLVRTVPGSGLIIVHDASEELRRVLAMGCWTPVVTYGSGTSQWRVTGGAARIAVTHEKAAGGSNTGEADFAWPGTHNQHNALAACAAAFHVGIPPQQSLAALASWRGVRRRLERVGTAGGITVYDDFAHHPTEIAATLEAMRRIAEPGQRIVALFEPRSNSMKQGVHAAALADSFAGADLGFLYQPPGLDWDIGAALSGTGVAVESDHVALLRSVISALRPGDQVAVMSNGAFGGMPQRLLAALQAADNTASGP